jgi:hypothetical protein
MAEAVRLPENVLAKVADDRLAAPAARSYERGVPGQPPIWLSLFKTSSA